MECSLGLNVRAEMQDCNRLNPYSNGMLTWRAIGGFVGISVGNTS